LTITGNTAASGEVVGNVYVNFLTGTEKPDHMFHIYLDKGTGTCGTEGSVGTLAFTEADNFVELQIDLATLLGSTVVSASDVGVIVAGRPNESKAAWSDVTPWNAGWVAAWGDGTCTLTIGTADYAVITLP